MNENIDFESSPDAYQVKLDAFEGPLDLLLHLIRKSELNIYDIPIALITEQYLGYITLMQDLNLDVAGEFLVMASTLIHIKSRTLLPRPDPTQDDAGTEEDPREALVRRLLEHQKYKAAAELLHERETLRSAQFMRPDERVPMRRRRLRAGTGSGPVRTAHRVQGCARAGEPAADGDLPPSQMSIEDRIKQVLGAALRNRSLRLRGSVQRRRRFASVPDRHVPRAARDDQVEVDSGFPVGRSRSDSRLQARAAGGRSAPD